MFNRPQNLKEVKSLAVAKTLLHTFCKQSENHKETWNEFDQYYKEEDFKKENIEQWEEQFDEWEKVLSKESRSIDQFIEKHNLLLKQRGENMEKQYDWIKNIKEKLDN